jgi:hypothetical protein
MRNRFLSIFTILILVVMSLWGCNLPVRQTLPTPTQPADQTLVSSPTPTPLCENPYFPNTSGDQWAYAGSNSLTGAYNRADTITNSTTQSFDQQTTIAYDTYSVTYDCSAAGLTSTNPIEQYAGALLNTPEVAVTVELTSNSGVTLPANIAPGDTWQQKADWQATSQQVNLNGRFVFDYTTAGYEDVTVPSGTYRALRVTGTIRIEVTGLHVLAGTYTTTSWWVPRVGLVKSEGTSHVPGVEFTDGMQLTSFTPPP